MVLHCPLSPQQWDLSAGLGLDCTVMIDSRHCHDCGPLMQFWSRDGRKLCSVLMDGIEWPLTHKLRQVGESLKTANLKMHSVWDLNAFRTSERYAKPSEIPS